MMKLIQKLALASMRLKFRVLTVLSPKAAAQSAFRLFCTPQERVKVPLTELFREADSLQFQLEGHRVQGFRWNQGGIRKVMLLHGFESSATNFAHYVQPLVHKGYEVLAFDAPANGRSEGKRITAPLYKQMIEEVHRQFGPVQSFLAHSFGGLALTLALESIPHDNSFRVVLIAPATETTTAIDNFFSLLHLEERVRAPFEQVIIDHGDVPAAWYSIRRAMQHISAQVLWFQDKEDTVTPLADVAMVQAEHFPNNEFVITQGLGHRRIYRNPEVVRQAVTFL